jgi:metal-dependent amidase/aminoacylase/carboxypeptidase family protein
MVHPKPFNCIYSPCLARKEVRVTFNGYAAHAAAFPWEGINALDAAVMAYASVSALRQQMRPKWRVHGVITNGGVKPNIIPDKASLWYYIRTPTEDEMEILQDKVNRCFEGAAKATGGIIHQ